MAAIHYGCSIVTTTPRVPVPEFVNDENMLFVPPSDSHALNLALKRIHSTPELANKLRQGASRLAAHFDWTYIAAEYVEFFRCVLGASA
jgi:glycosyltransferase involved in cell wall biosynthesis